MARLAEYVKKVNSRTLFVAALVLFSIVTTTSYLLEVTGAEISETKISTPDGAIKAYVIKPIVELKRDFVFVVVHGFAVGRTILKPLAVDLARAGFASLVIDLYGHHTAEPCLKVPEVADNVTDASIKALREMMNALPEVWKVAREIVGNETARIIVVGHSMGGAVAIMAGWFYPNDVSFVFAIAPLPPYNYVNGSLPRRLVVFIGDIDEIFSVEDEVLLLKKAGWEKPEDGQNMTTPEGVVRALYVMRGADHALELYSPEVVSKILVWMGATFGVQCPVRPFALLEFVLSVVIATLLAMTLSTLFPFALRPMFRYRPRKNITSIIVEPRPRGSARRDSIFTIIYCGMWVLLLSASWGQVLVPAVPFTPLRLLIAIPLAVGLFIVFYVYEYVRCLLVRRLRDSGATHPLRMGLLAAFAIKVLAFIVLPYLGMTIFTATLGVDMTPIVWGFCTLVAVVMIPVAFISEAISIPALIVTERRVVAAASIALPMALVLSAILPILCL